MAIDALARRASFCFLLCLMLTFGNGRSGAAKGQPERTGETSRAPRTVFLAVGMDRFVSMPPTEPASANNAETVRALMADFWPGAARIEKQVNGPGTAAEFEKLLTETFQGAEEGDLSILYLSTHGVSRPETGGSVALLLSDGEREEALSPEALREMLEKIPGEKVLIVDACRSGAFLDMGEACRTLVSAGVEEDSWFWSAETDEYAGTGYFTAALDNALRASDLDQIDPDGDGRVTLRELGERLRAIHGASTVLWSEREENEPLFVFPEDRKPGPRLQGLTFGTLTGEEESLSLPLSFRAGEAVRVTYLLAPWRGGKWDFAHAVKLPDREKTGLARGLLSPGNKERTIRLRVKSLGEEGRALLQIISLRGEERIPASEGGTVIEILPSEEEKSEDG